MQRGIHWSDRLLEAVMICVIFYLGTQRELFFCVSSETPSSYVDGSLIAVPSRSFWSRISCSTRLQVSYPELGAWNLATRTLSLTPQLSIARH